jgi:hypothetical protein
MSKKEFTNYVMDLARSHIDAGDKTGSIIVHRDHIAKKVSWCNFDSSLHENTYLVRVDDAPVGIIGELVSYSKTG